MIEQQVYHIPALLVESINALAISESGTYVDMTFGGGGHSRELLSRLGRNGRLFSFDQDIDAYANKIDDKRFCFVHSNFRYLKNFMQYYGVDAVDGIIADLGVSFHHFDTAERGFSFRYDAPLDMRMNNSQRLTAADILNTYDEQQLTTIFHLWGEVKNARKMAAAIVKQRATAPISTTSELTTALTPYIGKDKEKKELAQVFQALRIEVNDEMGALRDMLEATIDLLKPNGRLVVLTYHSLEDRIVKNFIRSGNIDGTIEKDFYGNVISPIKQVQKVVVPSNEEIEHNPRSRSAKLRVGERIMYN